MPRLYAALLIVALTLPALMFLAGIEKGMFAAPIVAAFTFSACLLFGLPLALWFIRRGWLSAWQAGLAGAGVGALIGALIALDRSSAPLMEILPGMSGIGAIHGLLFWLLAIFHNRKLPVRAASASTERSGAV